jgi:hypothetical protein
MDRTTPKLRAAKNWQKCSFTQIIEQDDPADLALSRQKDVGAGIA